jgi:hypothetical protein
MIKKKSTLIRLIPTKSRINPGDRRRRNGFDVPETYMCTVCGEDQAIELKHSQFHVVDHSVENGVTPCKGSGKRIPIEELR